MPKLPNFEKKIQILKLFVKSYRLGMKNPNFTKIGCVNCEVWKKAIQLGMKPIFWPKVGAKLISSLVYAYKKQWQSESCAQV